MKYSFLPINLEMLDVISLWRYKGKMKRIYLQPYYDNYNPLTKETLGPADCFGFGVYDGERLIGLFEYYFFDEVMEIGLAIAPELIGKGKSKTFILEGIAFGIKTYEYQLPFVQLHVDIDNESARIAYQKAGFKEVSKENNEILMKYYL